MLAHPSAGLRLLPLALGAIGLEIAWHRLVTRRPYPWREMLASLGVAGLRLPSRLLAPAVLAPLALFLWSHRLATVPLDTAWGQALLFLATELAYYWSHRAGHEVRWLWATHSVHHSAGTLHLASAVRLGATELLSGGWLFQLPLFLLGFHPAAVRAMQAISLFYQFWLHTDLIGRLGPLEWVLNTPSHHRVHHASNPEYLDRNFGGILILWDRLFGSFAAERAGTRIRYGLVHPVRSANPLRIACHEWLALARDLGRAAGWRERLGLLVGRPVARPAPEPR